MNYQSYLNEISTGVKGLSHHQKLELAWQLCTRLDPLYEAFQLKEKWGDSNLLIKVREAVKKKLTGESTQHLPKEDEIMAVTPDTDEFGSTLGSHALDTAISHIFLSRLLVNDDQHALESILSLCFDVVDRFEQECDDTTDGKFTNAEIAWQLALLSKRAESPDCIIETRDILHAALQEYR